MYEKIRRNKKQKKKKMLSLVSLFLALTTIFVVYEYRMKKNRDEDKAEGRMRLNVPHGPVSLPFIGNMLQLGRRPYETLFKMWDIYGPIFRIKLGKETVVVLNGTDIIREALIKNGKEFAGRPKLYMIHATLKGKGLISSPYNSDFIEHKQFLLTNFNRFGKRRSSLETNCLQTIRETLDSYREKTDHNLEFVSSKLKNSLSQIASQNILTITFGNRIHDKNLFSTLMDLIAENFKNAAVTGAFNFLPATRIFKTFILKNVFKCSAFLNDLVSEKMKEFNEYTMLFDDDDVELNEASKRIVFKTSRASYFIRFF